MREEQTFLYQILIRQSLELTMQHSHPSLYIINAFYDLYISDPI